MVKKSCSQFWSRVTAESLGCVTSLSWQVGSLSQVQVALWERENWFVFNDWTSEKMWEKNVCLALLWHPALFGAHETTLALKRLLCQWIGGKMIVCFCLFVCRRLNMPMCDPRCLVNCSLDMFVLHNLLTGHFFLSLFSLCDCCRCVNGPSVGKLFMFNTF